MTTDTTAADRLEAVLQAENIALLQPDLAAAASLLPEKLAAVGALGAAAPLPQTPAGADLAARLKDLGQENRRLLEKAILVQSRVVELVARAAQTSGRQDRRYGATGTINPDAGGITFVTRA